MERAIIMADGLVGGLRDDEWEEVKRVCHLRLVEFGRIRGAVVEREVAFEEGTITIGVKK